MGLSAQDRHDLQRVIKRVMEMLESDDEKEVERAARIDLAAFEGMLSRDRELSDRQRRWLYGTSEQLFDEPTYENLASSGNLCRGREVPTPTVLQNLPKKPPARRPTHG